MLTVEELKALAHKAAEGETGRREFHADLSWLVAFARLVEGKERERLIAALRAESASAPMTDKRTAFLWAADFLERA